MPEQVVDRDRAFELFGQLFEKTRNRKLSWSPTAQSGVFIAPVEGRYLFRALPAQQMVLPEPFGDEKLNYPRFQLAEGDDVLIVISKSNRVKSDDLNRLYELVRHQALRIEEKLSKVDGVLTKLREL